MKLLDTLTVGEISILVTLLATAVAMIRKVFPWVRQLVHFMDDVTGENARKGVPARPGLLERQAAVEATLEDIQKAVQQLRPNGGASAKDQLNRIDTAVQQHSQILVGLTDRMSAMQVDTVGIKKLYDEHNQHAGSTELELRAALAELQRAVLRDGPLGKKRRW